MTEEIQKMTKPKPPPKPVVEKVKKERVVKKEPSPEFDHGEEVLFILFIGLLNDSSSQVVSMSV